MEDIMRNTMNRMMIMLILVLVAAGAAWAGQPVNETIPVAPGSEISVENLAGSLTFEGWDSATLEVTGTLGDGVERLDIDVDEDGEIYLEVEFDEDYHGKQTQSTDLTIRLPAGSPLSVETVSASISVSGMSSGLDLETVSGAIQVRGAPTSLDIENVSGSIDVETAPSEADVASVSGLIEIGTVMGDIDVENVSGEIVINGGTLGDTSIETVSGDITCLAVPGYAGDVDMETMSGTITLLVDAGAVASYDVSTFSGSITNEIGPEPQRTSKYTPGKELSFNTGPGGPRISLESFSGAIKLLTR
jgi:hypothetical protein